MLENPEYTKLIEKTLMGHGIETTTETSESYDCCLIDYYQDKETGIEVFKRINEEKGRIPSLILNSHFLNREETMKLNEFGLNLMRKPLSPQDLINRIKEMANER